MRFLGKNLYSHYCIQNFNDENKIQVYNIKIECLAHFSKCISEEVKKISGSIVGKVKKIEDEAKWRFSYKENVYYAKYFVEGHLAWTSFPHNFSITHLP